MTKMFTNPLTGKRMKTWNIFAGCNFDCYSGKCWARTLVATKLAKSQKYEHTGFTPTFYPQELAVRFKPSDFVFIASMGDISFATWYDLKEVLIVVQKFINTQFLLQTKNPAIFLNGRSWESNLWLGATIETNRYEDYGKFSKAPTPIRRYHSFAVNSHAKKFLSIEPIMDFDPEIFLSWIKDINPQIVEVGADSCHANLPEPSPGKVKALLEALKTFVPYVVEKDNLKRLLRLKP